MGKGLESLGIMVDGLESLGLMVDGFEDSESLRFRIREVSLALRYGLWVMGYGLWVMV